MNLFRKECISKLYRSQWLEERIVAVKVSHMKEQCSGKYKGKNRQNFSSFSHQDFHEQKTDTLKS